MEYLYLFPLLWFQTKQCLHDYIKLKFGVSFCMVESIITLYIMIMSFINLQENLSLTQDEVRSQSLDVLSYAFLKIIPITTRLNGVFLIQPPSSSPQYGCPYLSPLEFPLNSQSSVYISNHKGIIIYPSAFYFSNLLMNILIFCCDLYDIENISNIMHLQHIV